MGLFCGNPRHWLHITVTKCAHSRGINKNKRSSDRLSHRETQRGRSPSPRGCPTLGAVDSWVLHIGNRRYSSWSLRAWLAVRASEVPFTCALVWLDTPTFAPQVRSLSGAGCVPLLKTPYATIWDSMAICETAAEHACADPLWPDDPARRAVARAYAAEMHAGFPRLRAELPMDLGACTHRSPSDACWEEITRVAALWRDARAANAHRGRFLFGDFSIADCMYAPVVTRFESYGVTLDRACHEYMDTILALPTMIEWHEASRGEPVLPDP